MNVTLSAAGFSRSKGSCSGVKMFQNCSLGLTLANRKHTCVPEPCWQVQPQGVGINLQQNVVLLNSGWLCVSTSKLESASITAVWVNPFAASCVAINDSNVCRNPFESTWQVFIFDQSYKHKKGQLFNWNHYIHCGNPYHILLLQTRTHTHTHIHIHMYDLTDIVTLNIPRYTHFLKYTSLVNFYQLIFSVLLLH